MRSLVSQDGWSEMKHVFLTILFFGFCLSAFADRSVDALAMAHKMLEGQDIDRVDTDPIDSEHFKYFESSVETRKLEKYGYYGENIYIGEPEVSFIKNALEFIEFRDDNGTKGTFETYIVRLTYSVVGNIHLDHPDDRFLGETFSYVMQEKLPKYFCTSFSEAQREHSYLIFVVDSASNKLKLAGFYPNDGFPDDGIEFTSLHDFMTGSKWRNIHEFPEFRKSLEKYSEK